MTVAVGVSKKVAFVKESTWNTSPSGTSSGAKYLRRVTSDIGLSKDIYESNEIRTDYQVADVRHGMRKVQGGIKGEWSPGAYSLFLGSALRKDFVALTALTNTSVTIAVDGAAPDYTMTAAGLWAAGFKAGMVIRLSASGSNTAKNLFVKDIPSSGSAKVRVLNGGSLTVETAAATTITMTGKYSYVPETGHTNDSYTVEDWYNDIAQSERFKGCRVSMVDLGLPATGIATCDVAVMGGDMATGTSQYFTSGGAPASAGTAGILTAVNGIVAVNGLVVATITGITSKIDSGMTIGAVVGSNLTPDVFVGRMKMTGQITAYFDSVTLRDAFLNETAFELLVALASDTTDASDFVTLAIYKAKANGAAKSDGEQGLTLTIPFQALFNSTPATNVADDTLRTTCMIQDSQAA